MTDEPFLSRWSRRKTEAKSAEPPAQAKAPAAQPPQTREDAAPPAAPEPLPPVDSLTPDSDFTPFMKADVDPALRRSALKKLLADPRFNVMDGLDVYIDDYSKPDPLPEGWLEKMNQVRYLGHYREEEDEEAAAPADSPEADAPADAMQVDAPAFPETDTPLDTSGEGKPAPPVAEKPDRAEGS